MRQQGGRDVVLFFGCDKDDWSGNIKLRWVRFVLGADIEYCSTNIDGCVFSLDM